MAVMLSSLPSFLPQIAQRQTSLKVLHFFFRGKDMIGDVTMNLMEVDVLRMLRYCRMSGTVIRRRARRNRSPVLKRYLS